MPLESKYAIRLGIIAAGVAIGLVLRQLAPPQTDVTTDETRSGGARPAAAPDSPAATSTEGPETEANSDASSSVETSPSVASPASADSR